MLMQDSQGLWSKAIYEEEQNIRRQQGLFKGEHKVWLVTSAGDRKPFPYITINWLQRLSQRYSEFVFPTFPRIYTDEGGDQEKLDLLIKTLQLRQLCKPTSLMVSYAGYAVWKLCWSTTARIPGEETPGSPTLRLWGANAGEIAVFDYLPGETVAPYAVNFWYEIIKYKNPQDTQGTTYKVRERYVLNPSGKGVTLETKAWKAEGAATGTLGAEVQLGEVWPKPTTPGIEFKPPEPTGNFPQLTSLPGFVIPNIDLNGDGWGDSDYTLSLEVLQKKVNQLAAQRQFVIDLTEHPMLSVPSQFLKADGTIDSEQMWMSIQYPGDEQVQVKVENWEGNLSKSEGQWKIYEDSFYALTNLVPAVDGRSDAAGGAESGVSKLLSYVKLSAGIVSRRDNYDPALEWAVRTAQELCAEMGAGGTFGQPMTNVRAAWPPPLPVDETETTQNVMVAFREGLMSKEKAVRRLNPGETDAFIQDELDRIEDDQQAAAERDLASIYAESDARFGGEKPGAGNNDPLNSGGKGTSNKDNPNKTGSEEGGKRRAVKQRTTRGNQTMQ